MQNLGNHTKVQVKVIILVSLLLLAMSGQAMAAFSGGSGTSDDPYQISTLDDLRALSENATVWDDDFKQTANININATEIQDWNEGKGFLPIGNRTTQFTGVYDGQNKTIDGLYINRPDEDYIGLFGRVGNATLRNLGLTNADIIGKSHTAVLIGGSVFGSGQTVVENCSSNGSVHGTNYVGGFIGSNGGSASIGITNSHNEANIEGEEQVGGLVGLGESVEIATCSNTGNVHANASDESRAGGLVGYGPSNIVSDSSNQGAVTGNGDYIGGLIGWNRKGQVESCQNTGNVGDGNAGKYIGGLIGANGNTVSSGIRNDEPVTNSTSTGNVTGTSHVGGLIGCNNAEMSTTAAISSCTSTGTVTASGDRCGGLIGNNLISGPGVLGT